MKKRRGAALAGAIILCSLIITVSFAISAVFLNLSANNIIRRVENQVSLEYEKAFNRFKNGETVENTTSITYEQYQKDEHTKALVARRGSENKITFYAIYDSNDGGHVLAYQESHFDVEYIDDKLYLGGVGPMVLIVEE